MDRRLFVIAGSLAAVKLLSGCASVGDARAEKGSGTVVVYAAAFDEVWKEMPRVLAELQLKLVADNAGTGEVLAESGAGVVSWGERVAVFLARGERGRTRVEVVSKKAVSMNFTATDWAPKIHEALRRRFKPA